jgi:predicted Rossmann fold nucleotide-binding protein DprA/Smf involved in DNA uptake
LLSLDQYIPRAKLVSNAEDIVEELNLGQGKLAKKFQKPLGETKDEIKIIDLLEYETKHIDQLSRESKFSSDKLNGLLLTMELSGKIKNIGGGNYSLTHQ